MPFLILNSLSHLIMSADFWNYNNQVTYESTQTHIILFKIVVQ